MMSTAGVSRLARLTRSRAKSLGRWLLFVAPAILVFTAMAPAAERLSLGEPIARLASPLQVTQALDTLDLGYYRAYVEPIFLKPRSAGEGAGVPCASCHTTMPTRLALQPLPPGATVWTEQQSLQNFQVVSQLVTEGDPLASVLLLNPLAVDAGGLNSGHTGGKFWQFVQHPDWLVLAAWVEGATTGEATAVAAAPSIELDYAFFRDQVQPIFTKKRPRMTPCYSCHGLGAGEGGPQNALRLQRLSAGATTWNEEESRLNFEELTGKVVPGNPQASPLLVKPLRPDVGGGPWHGGGSQFLSQNDPDWQTIAAWVMGARLDGDVR